MAYFLQSAEKTQGGGGLAHHSLKKFRGEQSKNNCSKGTLNYQINKQDGIGMQGGTNHEK